MGTLVSVDNGTLVSVVNGTMVSVDMGSHLLLHRTATDASSSSHLDQFQLRRKPTQPCEWNSKLLIFPMETLLRIMAMHE